MRLARHTLFGPPGTGKTTALIGLVGGHIASGIAPESIGFVSFSRRALKEARDQVAGVTEEDLPHFRTIHSTAYHMLGLSRHDVIQGAHLADFGKMIGLPISSRYDPQQIFDGAPGDRILALYGLARARQTTLDHEWRRARLPDLPWALVSRTVALYERYKEAHALWDFPDMIDKAEGRLDVEVLFVDEAQDTSAAQWSFLRRVARHVPVVYFAGDDDQAIYQWSGADPEQLLRLNTDTEVLPHSYRMPRNIKLVADKIARRIKRRAPKPFVPRDANGRVEWLREAEQVDLHQPGKWLLLARSNYQLKELRRLARQQGVVYTMEDGNWSWTLPSVQAALAYERLRKGKSITRSQLKNLLPFWHRRIEMPVGKEFVWGDVFQGTSREQTWMDTLTNMPLVDREYVRALRRSGESLTEPGRVSISTVHGAKGAEADQVVLLTDVSERVAAGARVDPDAEHRVQYVAVSRARERLLLIQPKSQTFWHF